MLISKKASNCTASGEYRLPQPAYCFVGNLVLRSLKFSPPAFRDRFLQKHSSYQTIADEDLGDREGLSLNKWEAMQMPSTLDGKSVLDIGCAEGYFSQQCARRGASHVLGIDTSLGRLMYASFMARRAGLKVEYRMGVFPNCKFPGKYEYVFALSVLHHFLRVKDLWKVMVLDDLKADRLALRGQLAALRSLTRSGGKCLIEVPYEYDDPAERSVVDFERFNLEIRQAGFARAKVLGSWDYNPKYRELKDRIIYVAEAG